MILLNKYVYYKLNLIFYLIKKCWFNQHYNWIKYENMTKQFFILYITMMGSIVIVKQGYNNRMFIINMIIIIARGRNTFLEFTSFEIFFKS